MVQIQNGKIRIVQGNMELEVRLLESIKCSLKAPMAGNMERTIREGAACRALYRFYKTEVLFLILKQTKHLLNMNIHKLPDQSDLGQ